MPITERIYRRTEAGLRAYESPDSGLPGHHRAILGLIEADTHSSVMTTSLLRRHPEKQIFDWLDELQKLGFVESRPVAANHDLDFTGGFSIAEIRAEQAAYAGHKA